MRLFPQDRLPLATHPHRNAHGSRGSCQPAGSVLEIIVRAVPGNQSPRSRSTSDSHDYAFRREIRSRIPHVQVGRVGPVLRGRELLRERRKKCVRESKFTRQAVEKLPLTVKNSGGL